MVLVATCLGMSMTMYSGTMATAVTPAIGEAFGASSTERQWISASFTLVLASLLLTGGAFGNRLGRRTAFLAGVVVFTGATLGCALAPSLWALVGFRVGQAVGSSLLLPPTMSILVHEYADLRDRARALGVWAGVAGLGLSAGPVVGGVIAQGLSWRAGFAAAFVIGVVAAWIGWVAIPPERHGPPDEVPPLDVLGTVLSVIGQGGLVYGLIESRNLGWTATPVMAGFVAAVLGIVAFVAAQARAARRDGHPLMPLELWRIPDFVAANVAGIVYFVCFTGILFFYSAEFQVDRHYSLLESGLAFLPMTLLMSVFAPVAGRLAARFGALRTMGVGMLVTAAGCLLLAAAPYDSGLGDVEWRLAFVGLGSGLIGTPMNTAVVSSVPLRHSGTAAAIHNTFRQIGSSLAVAALGVVVGDTTLPGFAPGLSHAMLGASVAMLVWGVVVLAVGRSAETAQP